MKTITTYQLKIDSKQLIILDQNYSKTMSKLINYKNNDISDFRLEIINEDSLMDDELNVITNYYINHFVERYLKMKNVDCPKMIEDFIFNAIKVLNKKRTRDYIYSDEYIILEIFRGNYYFRINVKRDVISKEKYEELRALGPDYLMGTSVMFEAEVLPAFYSFLYEYDAFDNPELNNLNDYQFGLA